MYLAEPDSPRERWVLVEVGETLEKRSQLSNKIIASVILPQFVIIPLAVVLVWFGLSQGLRPLTRLRERIESRREADLSPIAASRVLWQITMGRYRSEEDIYRIAYAPTWARWFTPDQTIRVFVVAHKSPLRSLEFATLRTS